MRKKLDGLGRVCIPVDIRRKLKFIKFQPLEVNLRGRSIIVECADSRCALCGDTRSLSALDDGQYLCQDCIRRVQKLS